MRRRGGRKKARRTPVGAYAQSASQNEHPKASSARQTCHARIASLTIECDGLKYLNLRALFPYVKHSMDEATEWAAFQRKFLARVPANARLASCAFPAAATIIPQDPIPRSPDR
jgi:hypothetical protein